MNDTFDYLWFTWLSQSQYEDFNETGFVPGYKDTRGDNVHKHHRIHNRPDHCLYLAIHTRWNATTDNDNYGPSTPLYLVVWKTSIHNIMTSSHHRGQAHSSIYFRRAEDISIEFNPVYNGKEAQPLNFRELMGPTIGVWTMESWHRIGTQSSTTLWLDH
eukprot:3932832-Amphidinium_carterae.1